eukprot:3060576-Rhodomonas_salina.3
MSRAGIRHASTGHCIAHAGVRYASTGHAGIRYARTGHAGICRGVSAMVVPTMLVPDTPTYAMVVPDIA